MAANITNNKSQKKIRFKIDHIDPLGQGVFKQDDQIYFIPKTLPGEEGIARVIKTRKGVNFTEPPIELSTQHPDRVSSQCQFYQQCSGCHYLHMNYSKELSFKEAALRKHLQKVIESDQGIKIIFNDERFHYRNRIQLHYDKKRDKIGYISTYTNQILDRPNCLLPLEEISNKVAEIYQMNIQNLPVLDSKGHIEISYKDNRITETFNQAYSAGGFTQVNAKINNIMLEEVLNQIPSSSNIIELFGGDGNLTNDVNTSHQRLIIDFYTQPKKEAKNLSFLNLDLYDEKSLSIAKHHFDQNYETLIIDPPRKGFPLIEKWINTINPTKILYISCNPATLGRDLKLIENKYQVERVFLLDMFPGTSHFESFVTLLKK